jgi:hypothetical protein
MFISINFKAIVPFSKNMPSAAVTPIMNGILWNLSCAMMLIGLSGRNISSPLSFSSSLVGKKYSGKGCFSCQTMKDL